MGEKLTKRQREGLHELVARGGYASLDNPALRRVWRPLYNAGLIDHDGNIGGITAAGRAALLPGEDR